MTRNEKRIIAVFCSVLLVLAGFILMRYYNRVCDYYVISETAESAPEQIPLYGYTFTTEIGDFRESEDSKGKISRRTFTHEVYTPENHALAVVTVSVTGSSSSDSFAISHISTSLSDHQQDGLTVSEHVSGETATVVLYLNQISICHFQYRLSPDGFIDSI